MLARGIGPARNPFRRAARLALVAAAFAFLFAVVFAELPRAQEGGKRRSAAELMDVLMWNREPVGGPFALTDQSGRPRTDVDFRGKLLLVYFGFTFCPDICPTDLQEIARVIDQLGPASEQIQPVFITLDPERDTAEHLAEYVPLFHPRLIGLTGSAEAIRQAADAYKVFYDKVETGEGEYTIDHTAYVYLMDRSGGYLGFFPPNTSAERMLTVVRPHLTGK